MEKDKAQPEAEDNSPQQEKHTQQQPQEEKESEQPQGDKNLNKQQPQEEPQPSQEEPAQQKAEAPETKEDKALDSEHDLREHEEDHDDDDEHDHEEDYSEYSKEQLVDLIKELAKSDNVLQAEKKARELKPFFDEYFEKQRARALEKFLAEGGSEEDFSYKLDDLDNRFEANYRLIRDRKFEYQKLQETRKEENLKKKQEILERLREFVDSDEASSSFDTFKEIQEEWKNVGPVAPAHARTLWANYNALVDRFYDNRSIYFELKELDRKKNLEAKLALCERAEKLSQYDNIKEAIKELNELHHDFKYIGPVPKEEQENVWQRFKAASDAVYSRRKEYVDVLKEELGKNEEIKRQLAEKVQEFVNFDSDRIKEWNAKTKEILEIQKKWEATGGLPRAHAREINKLFWNAFKKFFQHKSAFFKRLDSQREENLAKKQELVKQAQELKESTEWQEAAEKLKALQRHWKEIGPVPEKVRDQVYREFKEACDYFFDRKRANTDGAEKDYQENLSRKEEVLDNIEKLAEEGSQDIDALRELQDQYDEIGFVPKRDISRIKNRYTEVVDKFIAQLEDLTEEDRKELKLESQVIKMKQGPNADHKLHKKEVVLRKQIAKVENEIAIFKNNIEFFSNSKKAEKLKDEFTTKIREANQQLKDLKQQLRIIRNA
jgi:predicted DCC family thiol-disulfide oxidoreductase YuxK